KIGQDALTGRAALAERLMSPRGLVMRFVGTALSCVWVLADSVVAAEPVDYLRAVKPILAQHCWSCHGPTRQKSGLRLDTAAAAVRGGNSGPAVVAGNSRSSRLIQAVTGARN